MPNEGWIKLHRRLASWEWYGDPNVVLVFLDILIHTNFKHTKWRGINLAPGQLVWGRKAAADRIGISERNVRTAMNKLKSTNELTIKTTNKYSIVTVSYWQKYQDSDQQNANDRPTSDQQVTTDEECKEVKKDIDNGARGLSADWQPNSKSFEIGEDVGYDDKEVWFLADQFRDHWLGNGKRKKDWDRAFYNWIRNDLARKTIEAQRKSGGCNGSDRSFAERASDIASRMQQLI